MTSAKLNCLKEHYFDIWLYVNKWLVFKSILNDT